MSRTIFYCAADTRNVVGAVGLLNSLRLQGHRQELIVLDAGLTEDDRTLLEPHARVVASARRSSPYFRKFDLPPTDADVHVVIDADVVVTRPLDDLIYLAAAGRVVAFEDPLADRFDPRWADLLQLGAIKPHPYVNAGLLALPDSALPLLDAVVEYERVLDPGEVQASRAATDHPMPYRDQDVLNALLGVAGAPDLTVLEHRLAPHPPFRDLLLVDEERLHCAYRDGSAPFILHHVLAKPWLAHTRPNIYSRLLRRSLLSADVELRLESRALPLRLRETRAAALARLNASVRGTARAQRGRLGLRRRLPSLSQRTSGAATAD